jgi:hypothetical protein
MTFRFRVFPRMWVLTFVLVIILTQYYVYKLYKDADIQRQVGLTAHSKLLEDITNINLKQEIRNLHLGPVTDESVVIVIQVHKRFDNLNYLIKSLQRSKGIEECLVIFSHDYWDEDINQLVQSINFVKFMQIYYPYTIQLFDDFPGSSPNDCPRNEDRNR